MAELKRVYKSKNLIGKSFKEYNFSGYSMKNYELIEEPSKDKGIFFIGKIDDDDRVQDHFELQYTDDIFGKFKYYKHYILQFCKNDIYHFFVLEEDDNSQIFLDNTIIDLNKENYIKKLIIP